ncbi:MAG TPA: metallophosphoesterase [Draconibacterium sp.]|nr:metallophosphoesterase [Draconibacterium sp.]
MKNKLVVQTCLLLFFLFVYFPLFSQVKIGVFADCQYCDCETAGSRFYRNSLSKLEDCITEFNETKKLKFVVGLGDLIDRDISSFESVNAILASSKQKVYHVIGNHDLAVDKKALEQVPDKLNLKETWYSFTKKGWHFIFLNGNDISFHSNNQEILKMAKEIADKLKKENKPNFYDWNGGIGPKQMKWLEKELQNASDKKLKVAVFCHYPLLPFEAHALWNSEEVLGELAKYSNVKLYLNGHNHAGNYVFQNGIHFINLKGMVETENKNAFAIISLSDEKIEIEGFGREETRSFSIK